MSRACLDRDERGAVERDDGGQQLERGGSEGLTIQPGRSHDVDRRRVHRSTSSLQQPRGHGSAHRSTARFGHLTGPQNSFWYRLTQLVLENRPLNKNKRA